MSAEFVATLGRERQLDTLLTQVAPIPLWGDDKGLRD